MDYIFRNQALAAREEALCVDYVRAEDGRRWVSPSLSDSLLFGYLTTPLDRVISLDDLGCTSRQGLDVVAAAWAGRSIDDNTHWEVVRALNVEIVCELEERGLVSPAARTEDRRRVVDHWTFPMTGLDLELIKVELPELEAERARRSRIGSGAGAPARGVGQLLNGRGCPVPSDGRPSRAYSWRERRSREYGSCSAENKWSRGL